MGTLINGFSKLSKEAKMEWVVGHYSADPKGMQEMMMSFWHESPELQKILDGFSENTISNFVMPFSLAPNFVINGKVYCVPMVIEESSVVAAASASAKYWMERGGFTCEIFGTKKIGQLHFSWPGDAARLKAVFPQIKIKLLEETAHLTKNMEQRGGGILDLELLDMCALEPEYYQIRVTFETCDSMGANFINSILEEFGLLLNDIFESIEALQHPTGSVNVIMAILSNYTPDCLVRASVECPVDQLWDKNLGMEADVFAEKFAKAIRIAEIDPYRATTHNKGIFNGIDAVILATANDFRAIEACGHAYAAKDGQYSSLSHCEVRDGKFRFWMDIPLAIGTVGGLTHLHPMANCSLEILGHPSADELMQVVAAVGLAQNFAAVRSLITTGIQKGHMKMHLTNILNHLQASESEIENAIQFFEDRKVSFSTVRDFLKR
ncbi:MAG: hydroxymethylglutaryl-CoA reductase, degradative [Saprospiraceae bacterium]